MNGKIVQLSPEQGRSAPEPDIHSRKCVQEGAHDKNTRSKDGTRCQFTTTIDSVDYTIANDARSADDIFQLRYRVFVNSDHYFADNDTHRISDKYDFLDKTLLIQAHHKARLIGSVRLVINGEAGIPSDVYFDIRAALHSIDPVTTILDSMIADLSRIVVEKEFRNNQIGYHLMTIGHLLGIENGVRYFIGISNPKTMTLFVNRLGWQQVGDQQFDSVNGVPYIPIIGMASQVKVYGRE